MSSSAQRFDRLDALRGLAIVWMASYHFCFDLRYFNLTASDFYRDPFWITQRTVIVSTFLLCAGMGQAVAVAQRQSWPRFWRRWAQIAGCALLVSAASWWMFPRSFISFGVLHAFALMLLLLRWGGRRLPQFWAAALGVVMAVAPFVWQSAFFDSRWTDWMGLVTHKPITEDYVPLLPWAGPLLLGFVLGRGLLQARPELLQGAVPRLLSPIARLGRWSLTFYMLHQPVLMGLLWVWTATIHR